MKYSNSPIKEAVFDIQVTGLDNITQEDIEILHELIKINYPQKKKTLNIFGDFEIKDNSEITNNTKTQFKGIIFSNEKNNRQVQFRVDGFTLNFLAPYSNWEEFYNEALFLWNIYFNAFKPKNINRIALRYINKIDIPLPLESFQEYITNMPPIPKSLPQFYNGFFMQIQVPCKNEKYTALITETIETPTKYLVPFILDIDIFKEINNDFEFTDFNYIRSMKNLIFEDFITDKTRILFNYEPSI
jgi:uncharacterized protein (TIGR04255 family)